MQRLGDVSRWGVQMQMLMQKLRDKASWYVSCFNASHSLHTVLFLDFCITRVVVTNRVCVRDLRRIAVKQQLSSVHDEHHHQEACLDTKSVNTSGEVLIVDPHYPFRNSTALGAFTARL